MTKSDTFKLLIVTALIALTAVLFFKTPQPANATGPFSTVINAATSSTQITVIGSTRILATTSSPTDPTNSKTRVYTSICNNGANPVYLNLNNDKAAASSTMTTVIAAAAGYNACYEITDRNQYQGSITASSTVSSVVSVADYVQ